MTSAMQSPPSDPPPDMDDDKEAGLKATRIKPPGRLIVVEPILIIFALSGYPMMLLIQQYIYKVYQDENNATSVVTNQSNCHDNMSTPEKEVLKKTQTEASNFQMYLTISQTIPTLFVTLFLGAYSDKMGRRYAILPPLIGCLVKVISCVLVIFLNLPLWYLLIGSLIEGFGGGFSTLLLGCFAYVSDMTVPEKRAFRIIIVEMSMFLSAAVGPIGFNIWLHKEQNYLYPFLVVLGGYSIAIIYAIFFVPETIIKDQSGSVRFFSSSHVIDTCALFVKDNGHKRRWKLTAFLISFTPIAFITMGGMSVDTLFEMNEPLCWVDIQLGIFSTVYIVVATLGAVTFARLMKICVSDEVIVLIAGYTACLTRIYKGFVINSVMMYILPVISIPSLLCIPTIRTLMSKLVHSDEQGAVFGALAFVEVLCSMIGGIVIAQLYNATLYISSGFVFFIEAGFILLGAIMLTFTCVMIWKHKPVYRALEEIRDDSLDQPADTT